MVFKDLFIEEKDKGKWITVDGKHIHLDKGETFDPEKFSKNWKTKNKSNFKKKKFKNLMIDNLKNKNISLESDQMIDKSTKSEYTDAIENICKKLPKLKSPLHIKLIKDRKQSNRETFKLKVGNLVDVNKYTDKDLEDVFNKDNLGGWIKIYKSDAGRINLYPDNIKSSNIDKKIKDILKEKDVNLTDIYNKTLVDRDSVLLHEIGHHVMSSEGNYSSNVSELTNDEYEEYLDIYRNNKSITKYGEIDFDEDFAESFSLYIMLKRNEKHLKNKEILDSTEQFKFMNRFFKRRKDFGKILIESKRDLKKETKVFCFDNKGNKTNNDKKIDSILIFKNGKRLLIKKHE